MRIGYDWDKKQNRVIADCPAGFDLAQTLECGQCFRWEREIDGSYTGVAHGRIVKVAQRAQELTFFDCRPEDFENIWIDYFDLRRNYEEIRDRLSSHDETMHKAITFAGGIHILRQDPWETLVSFIVSQNANIPRIKKCIAGICDAFGSVIEAGDGRTFHAFPDPAPLADCPPCGMDPCRLGYRAGYIRETAGQVMADGARTLYEACDMDGDAVEAYLLGLRGVGPKVADCVMLFGMGHYERFPTDVWIKRAMALFYGLDENDAKGIAAYAKAEFGELAGFAQQYLFQYMRFFSRQ